MLQFVLSGRVAMETTARRIVAWIVCMEYVTEDQDNVLWAVKWVGKERHVLQVRTKTVNRIFVKLKKYTKLVLEHCILISKHRIILWQTCNGQYFRERKSLSAILVFIFERYVHLALCMIQRNLTVHYQLSVLNMHEITGVLIVYLCYDCSARKTWSEKRNNKNNFFNMISVTGITTEPHACM